MGVVEAGDGRDPTTPTETAATPTPTPSSAEALVIPAGETHKESAIPQFIAIEWYATGRLILEDGADLRLPDMGQIND